MRQGPHSKRGRGRGGNRRSGPPTRNHTFDSNGPDIRIRGNAHQVHEKYMNLAREASTNGEVVLAEGYFQHAEHYYRILSAFTDDNNADSNRNRNQNNTNNQQNSALPTQSTEQSAAAATEQISRSGTPQDTDKTPTKGDLEEVGIEKNEGDISSNDKPTLALRSRQRVESSHETNMPDEQDTNKTSAPSAALPQNSKATRVRKRSKIIIDKESQASPVTDNEVNPTPSIE